MNKRGTKILIGCVLSTMIVLLLFLIVFRFTQLSCELVSLDPVQLASSQLASFARDNTKPIRSHDETILMRISAYLEYNIGPEAGETTPSLRRPTSNADPISRTNSAAANWPNQAHSNLTGASNNSNNLSAVPSAVGNTNKNLSISRSPQPLTPQIGLTNQNNNTAETAHVPGQIDGFDPGWEPFAKLTRTSNKTEKRFLPLELKSIETRNMPDGRHKYILNFNCTKINMLLVHQDNRVYVAQMVLELRPTSRQETTCVVQLPPAGEFTVADSSQSPRRIQQPPSGSVPIQTIPSASGQTQQATLVSGGSVASLAPTNTTNNSTAYSGKHHTWSSSSKDYSHLAHYHCNKPLRYRCYDYNSKSGQSNGNLLAELHINGIEFETSTNWQGKHEKVKSEFKGERKECNI